ncbi:hypothetical protein FOVSG1_001875 [Fusarium oxysporum f. sp. vasinfectum]
MAEVLLRFLSNKNQSRTRAMSSFPSDRGAATGRRSFRRRQGLTTCAAHFHEKEFTRRDLLVSFSPWAVELRDCLTSQNVEGGSQVGRGQSHLRGGSRVKLNQLENMEQLVVQEKGPATAYPIGGISRPIDITTRLCTIADQLRDSPTLRQLSIEFHPRIMTWIMLPAQRLNPGQRHRTELDTFVMTGIMAMGARLPQVEEICLVERSAVFNGVNMIHRGVRDPEGEMAVTIEAPGHENTFPLNISH